MGMGRQMVIVDVVVVTDSLSPRWIIELLKYSNGVVLLTFEDTTLQKETSNAFLMNTQMQRQE